MTRRAGHLGFAVLQLDRMIEIAFFWARTIKRTKLSQIQLLEHAKNGNFTTEKIKITASAQLC